MDLASDQTSLHNPFNGGYYPVQLTYSEADDMMTRDPSQFKSLVEESLRRHVKAVNSLCDKGTHFWDYGNAFLLEVWGYYGNMAPEKVFWMYPWIDLEFAPEKFLRAKRACCGGKFFCERFS